MVFPSLLNLGVLPWNHHFPVQWYYSKHGASVIPCSQSISITSHYRSIDIPFILDYPIVCHDFTNMSHETPLFWIICNKLTVTEPWNHGLFMGNYPNIVKHFRIVNCDHLSKVIRPKLPSDKRLHNYGKSPCYQWVNPLFLWQFSIANCKRLPEGISWKIWKFMDPKIQNG